MDSTGRVTAVTSPNGPEEANGNLWQDPALATREGQAPWCLVVAAGSSPTPQRPSTCGQVLAIMQAWTGWF